jgi:hypothetical protein
VEAGGEEFAAKAIAGVGAALVTMMEDVDVPYLDVRSLKITVNGIYEAEAIEKEAVLA